MEIYVFDPNSLDKLGIVDKYSSLLWNPSYSEVGTFQLQCDIKFFSLLQTGRFVQNTEDFENFGVIEYVEKVNSNATTFMVIGRMGESLFDRRVVEGTMEKYSVEPSAVRIS